MNRALWRKGIGDARLLCVSLVVLLFTFHWLFVWLSSLIELGPLGAFLQALPPEFEKLAGVPFSSVTTPVGRIALAFVDPVVVFSATVWGIGRGSDAVSGEISRGTMELLLAQPVRRLSLLVVHGVVTTVGAAAIAAATVLGTWAGLATVDVGVPIAPATFLPGALNVFALMFFLAGLTTMVSAGDNYRWRTIGVVGAFYFIQLIVKVVARLVDWAQAMMYFTFLGAFEPQRLVVDAWLSPDAGWQTVWQYTGALVGLGLLAYVAAAIVFCRRDLPAPL